MSAVEGAARDPVMLDAAEAQRADFSYRMLRFSLIGGATQWIFVAALLAVQKHKLPPTVVIPLAALGVTVTLWILRHFRQRHRTVLARFIDPFTGELAIPGDRRSIPPRFTIGGTLLIIGEIALLASGLAANYVR